MKNTQVARLDQSFASIREFRFRQSVCQCYIDIRRFFRFFLPCFPALLKQLQNQACPASLVTRTQTLAGIAVEILVKQNEVAPVHISLEFCHTVVNGPSILPVTEDDTR